MPNVLKYFYICSYEFANKCLENWRERISHASPLCPEWHVWFRIAAKRDQTTQRAAQETMQDMHAVDVLSPNAATQRIVSGITNWKSLEK